MSRVHVYVYCPHTQKFVLKQEDCQRCRFFERGICRLKLEKVRGWT